MGRILLIVNYLFPILFMIFMHSRRGELTDIKLLIMILIIFVIYPAVYILLNINISKLMRLSSSVSALIMFTGLIQIEIADYLIRFYKGEVLQFDAKTINLYVIRVSYYIFVSGIYYLIKKDDNIKIDGEK